MRESRSVRLRARAAERRVKARIFRIKPEHSEKNELSAESMAFRLPFRELPQILRDLRGSFSACLLFNKTYICSKIMLQQKWRCDQYFDGRFCQLQSAMVVQDRVVVENLNPTGTETHLSRRERKPDGKD